jgi:3-keto-5-aminohexanoate cleavage enzyme
MDPSLDISWYVDEGNGDPLSGEPVRVPPLVINAALTGMIPKKADNPHVPTSPREIVEDAARCFRAGARVLHLHARDPNEEPEWQTAPYAEMIPEIRRRCPGVIVCATTSGRTFPDFERRSAVLALEGAAKPDAASLTTGSLNFPTGASVNDPQTIIRLARLMGARGIATEVEIFEPGMLHYARYLEAKGILKPPRYFNLLLGSLGTIPAGIRDLEYLVSGLPAGAAWGAAGIGMYQLPMNLAAIVRGGHVRVGLEDNLWFDRGKMEPATNQRLVERLAHFAEGIGRRIATPDEARAILGIPASLGEEGPCPVEERSSEMPTLP